MTTAVITGIQGFIGGHLKKACELLGWEVHGTTREDTIASTVKLLKSTNPAYIFHTAAELTDESKMYETNVALTHAILDYCVRLPQGKKPNKLVIFGSSSEYGRKTKPSAETDALEPETIYEGTKAAATYLARSYSITYNIPTVVIRPFTVYGQGEKFKKLIQVLLKLPKEIELSAGVHDYIYITDFIDAVFKIINTPRATPFDIVNVGTGKQTTNLEVVKLIEKYTGHSFYTKPRPSKPYDSDTWVCDTTYSSAEYGLKPKYSIEDGLKFLVSDLYNGTHR